MWESNPPARVLTGLHGFEDRRGHQSPSAPSTQRAEDGTDFSDYDNVRRDSRLSHPVPGPIHR